MEGGRTGQGIGAGKKLPNLYKARENAPVYFLEDEEKHKVARQALKPLAWVIVHQLSALYEAEGDPAYRAKASKMLDVLFDGEPEDNVIRSIRKKISG